MVVCVEPRGWPGFIQYDCLIIKRALTFEKVRVRVSKNDIITTFKVTTGTNNRNCYMTGENPVS